MLVLGKCITGSRCRIPPLKHLCDFEAYMALHKDLTKTCPHMAFLLTLQKSINTYLCPKFGKAMKHRFEDLFSGVYLFIQACKKLI